MENVAGLDISVRYDATTLSNPRVAMGSLVSGMASAVNPSNPIRLAIVGTTGIKQSGTIATITFDRIGGSSGKITDLSGTLIDPERKKVAMLSPSIQNPSDTDLQGNNASGSGSGSSDSTGNVTTASTSTNVAAVTTNQPFIVGGTLTLPPTETAGNEKRELSTPPTQPIPTAQTDAPERREIAREAAAPPADDGESSAQATKAAARAVPVPEPAQSVLERFRIFRGERTVGTLTALFDRNSAAPFVQSPAIVIADGKATVKLVISKVTGNKAPNFAFDSASFVSVAHTGDGEWEVIARPDGGTVKASVIMFSDGLLQDFPLTVAPKSEVVPGKPGESAETSFLLFLKERGTALAPKFDLNGDGRRDYVDDYIFTANYLVKLQDKPGSKKQGAEQKKQGVEQKKLETEQKK
jgi:hypothetical protein